MSEAIQSVIHDIVEQIKNPITDNPKQEVEELVAELVGTVDKLRMWEVKRGDWVGVP